MRRHGLFAVAALGLAALSFFSFRSSRPVFPVAPPVPPVAGGPISVVPAPSLAWATARSDGLEMRGALPPALETLWKQPGSEPALAAFVEWTRRYQQAAMPEARAILEAEGVALATARRNVMVDLIQRDPQLALDRAVPFAVRRALPDSIQTLLEEPVNTRGDLQVMGVLPGPDGLAGLPPVLRSALIAGESYEVFTSGAGLRFVTRDNVPFQGISLSASLAAPSAARTMLRPAKIMALAGSPARRLDRAEVELLKQQRAQDPVCSTSGQAATSQNDETVVQLDGDLHSFCGQVHAEDWANAQIAALGLDTPAVPGNLLTAKSSYTEGRKRMLCLRPYWTNQAVALTTNAALTHWVNFSNYMFQMSYGKMAFAPLQKGSDISAEILMPGSVDDYTAGLGSIYSAIKEVARTNYGYNIGQYDFIYYCTGGKPAASYAGLGFVGGVGFHLANSYFDAATSAHEFGHNLALNHAHFWNTESQSIIGAGQNVEYGDGNDPMGGGGNPNQFNSRYKNYLGWITNSDIADLNVLGSGRYRLYSFDLDHSTVGTRGLKFRYNSAQNYWLNFRQRKNTKALNNGVQLLWADNGNGGSYLLDVRLRGGSSDNAVVIGRTFSDTNLNFHFTPVGKGNTYPESMDVVVFTGAQPGNLPPAATLSASSRQANPGEALTFTASASDPNGDALAYYWEFSDSADNYSIDNSPVQTKAFSAAGEYTVRCVVSDMRGGTAQHTLVVRVGSPATFRISGHAVDDKNRPLAGIRVEADASHYAFTDSDGSYTLVNLAAGSYSLSAIEPVAGAMTLVHPYFSNPLVVGPDFTTADFVGVPGSLTLYTPLAAKTSSGWKYHDKGVDQGAAWRESAFADAGWSNGVAPLGYPSGAPISTVVSYGADANNKYPTYYFRKQFNVANPAAFTNLLLEVLRDDSAAVYLNGTEVYRDNLPAGTITYNTFAVDNSGASAYSQTTLPISAIVAGVNTLAVEVHQANATSSDIVMDAAVSGLSASSVSGLNVVYLSSPADTQVFSSPTNVTLTAGVFSAGTVSLVEFYADGAKIGQAAVAPFTMVWNSPADGSHLLRCVATINSLLVTSPPVTIVVAPPAPVPTVATLLPLGAVWKYYCTNVGAAAGWSAAGFNDSAWSSGPAKLGFTAAGVVTTFYGGPSAARYPTAYFRRAFVVEDPAGLTNLSLRLQRDDGAVVYLNGVEVVRDNIQEGIAVTYATLATAAADNGTSFFSYSLPAGALKHGTNIVAVEVHQTSASSSDLAFDLGLSAVVLTNRTRGCWLVAPSSGATIPSSGSVTLQAEAVAGGPLGLTKIEFFSDGLKIGEDTASPFTVNWVNAPAGAHVLTALATDSAGVTISSASVNITVLPPPLGSAFVSLGDVWRYLDNGSNQGTNWTTRTFDDRLWMSGPARLGYGGDGETTTVSFGTNAATKYITTYFRKAFTVANPATFSGLHLRLIHDDGAAVYLNGKEVFRSNLQPGPLSWNSLALAAVDGVAETTGLETTLPTTGLVAGTNVLAVEIHQAAVNSSDLGFDLALSGLDDTNTATGLYLASPAQGTHYNLPASVSLSSFAAAPAPVTLVEYFAGAVKVAEAAAPPYLATWSNPAGGSHVLTAVATYGAGLLITSAPVSISVGNAPAPITPVFVTLVPPSSGWKYWDSAAAASPGWEKTSFDDTAWPAANARFGWGLDGEITPLNVTRVTHYFRRWFGVTNLGQLSELFFYLQRDDGAVVYLNGSEIYRQNMPAGPVSSATLAVASVNTPDETIWNETALAIAGSGLGASNLVAVELHQSSAASSDGAFDFALYGLGSTERRIYLSAPGNNAALNVSSPITLEAGAWAGTGRTVTNVEFYVDGLKIGSSAAAPHRLMWSSPTLGQHILLARMFDDLGATQDSAPLPVNITRELLASTFIPAGAVWKFLDNGFNQGTNWAQPAFNDTSWSSGPARLGFGNDGEVLPALSGQPVITYYFRKTFVVPAGAVYTNLNFRLVRDDGAVVWLNGREAYRSNMGAGVIAYNTRPSASVGGADEQTFFPTSVTVTNLPAGTNLVAVEVHQFDGTSSDLGFNLELVAAGYLENVLPPSTLVSLADGMVEISWPATFTGYQVYTAPDLNSPPASWTPSGLTPVSAGGRFFVTIVPTNNAQFYRLQK